MKVPKRIQHGCISRCRTIVCISCRKVLDGDIYWVQPHLASIYGNVNRLSKLYRHYRGNSRKMARKKQEKTINMMPDFDDIGVGNVKDKEDKVTEYSSKREHMGSSYRGGISWIRQ